MSSGSLSEDVKLKRESKAEEIIFDGKKQITLKIGDSTSIAMTASGLVITCQGSVISLNAEGIKINGAKIGLNDPGK